MRCRARRCCRRCCGFALQIVWNTKLRIEFAWLVGFGFVLALLLVVMPHSHDNECDDGSEQHCASCRACDDDYGCGAEATTATTVAGALRRWVAVVDAATVVAHVWR